MLEKITVLKEKFNPHSSNAHKCIQLPVRVKKIDSERKRRANQAHFHNHQILPDLVAPVDVVVIARESDLAL